MLDKENISYIIILIINAVIYIDMNYISSKMHDSAVIAEMSCREDKSKCWIQLKDDKK